MARRQRLDTAFDVLVVGYVSRFLRNLKQTLIAVEDHLQTAGVVVLFADERLLSSDPSSWDQFIREAHEAEAYSRKLSKRVSEGYAVKRRRLGVPGGNKMPYCIVREGKPSHRSNNAIAAGMSQQWDAAYAESLANAPSGRKSLDAQGLHHSGFDVARGESGVDRSPVRTTSSRPPPT